MKKTKKKVAVTKTTAQKKTVVPSKTSASKHTTVTSRSVVSKKKVTSSKVTAHPKVANSSKKTVTKKISKKSSSQKNVASSKVVAPKKKVGTTKTSLVKKSPLSKKVATPLISKTSVKNIAPKKSVGKGTSKLVSAKSVPAKLVSAKSIPAKPIPVKPIPAKSIPAKPVSAQTELRVELPSVPVPKKSQMLEPKEVGNSTENAGNLSATEIEGYKRKLITLRARLSGDVSTMTDAALNKNRLEASGDLSVMPIHMADVGTDNFEQEQTLSFMQNESGILEQVNDALDRIKDGTFGICEGCGCRIPKIRLNFLPYAAMCVKCTDRSSQEE